MSDMQESYERAWAQKQEANRFPTGPEEGLPPAYRCAWCWAQFKHIREWMQHADGPCPAAPSREPHESITNYYARVREYAERWRAEHPT